jgi:hypothetical protein
VEANLLGFEVKEVKNFFVNYALGLGSVAQCFLGATTIPKITAL